MARRPAVERFVASMQLDFSRWKDGEAYDEAAIAEMNDDERAYILGVLTERASGAYADWRDVDALAAIGSIDAAAVLEGLRSHSKADIRLRACRRLEELGHVQVTEREVVRLLRDAGTDVGIDAVMTAAQEHPTVAVREALLWCAVDGSARLRVHAAALSLFLAGRSDEPFEWARRPLFLRFGEENREERLEALQELRALFGPEAPNRA